MAFAAAAAAWMWWGMSTEQARFAGSNRAISIQAILAEPSPPIPELEVVEAPVSIEVYPLHARIEKQRFIDTTLSPSLPTIVDIATDVTVSDWETAESRALIPVQRPLAEPESVVATVSRTTHAPPPTTISGVAVTPQQLGTDQTEPPSFIHNRPPNYPDLARQRGWQGTVLLRLSIDATGRVVNVDVAQSSGYAVLDAAAVNAVRQWRAKPAQRQGRPMATVELLPIRFVLD